MSILVSISAAVFRDSSVAMILYLAQRILAAKATLDSKVARVAGPAAKVRVPAPPARVAKLLVARAERAC